MPTPVVRGNFDCLWRSVMQQFGKTFLAQVAITILLTVCVCSTAWAQQPRPILDPIRNFSGSIRNIGRTTEADPNKEYKLTETEGPYLILATALTGPTALQDAHNLVLELRSKYKWNAYVFEKDFAREANQILGQAKGPKKLNRPPETQFAVLIGNFPSLEDNQYKRTLEEVRKCQPESLNGRKSVAAFSFPMAYGLANPMLPPEHRQGTVDAFVESLNKHRPYSLLQNPCRYTVQIAVFTGRTVIDPKAIQAIESGRNSFDREESALEIMGQAAVELCKILRENGWEAYEFHDRFSSIVTVGGFNQSGLQQPDGTMVPDPRIQQIIQQYKGRMINGYRCSSEPTLIEVPRVARR